MKEQWTTKLGFIIAVAGSVIRLGAIWKFPYMTGISGGGAFFLFFFLLLFLFATLTSNFSMLEIIVATMTKERQENRIKISWITGLLIFIVGIPATLSSDILSEFTLFNLTMIGLSDYLVSNILMPLGAL